MTGVWIRRKPIAEPDSIAACPVCYETFKKDSAIFLTDCNHQFCQECSQKILKTESLTCPICRTLLLKEKAFISQDDCKQLGLFILNKNFFSVPGSIILLRVFEPRYLFLIKRCIANGTCFGLQSGFKAGRGLLIHIKRHREIEGGHLIIECLAIGRYVVEDETCQPIEEEDAFGLYHMRTKLLEDDIVEDKEIIQEIQMLSLQTKQALELQICKLSEQQQTLVRSHYGYSQGPSDFSLWILGALNNQDPEVKAEILFDPSVVRRLRYCANFVQNHQENLSFLTLN